MTPLLTSKKRNWSPMVIGALAAAAVLLAAGVLMAVYQEQLYSAQQAKSVREQAQILAASVTAAVVFNDQKAAQEYVEALGVNPELSAAAVYGGDGRMIAGFGRGTRLPAVMKEARDSIGSSFIDVAAPVSQNGNQYGMVFLRAQAEPGERRVAR